MTLPRCRQRITIIAPLVACLGVCNSSILADDVPLAISIISIEDVVKAWEARQPDVRHSQLAESERM